MRRVLLIAAMILGFKLVMLPMIAVSQPRDDDLGIEDNIGLEQGEHGHRPPPSDEHGRPGPGEGRPDMHKMREQFGQKLGITDDQRKKIQEIRGDPSDREKGQLQERLTRIELRELLQKGSASDDEVMKKVHELNGMMAKQNEERVGRLLAIRKILTPEQRERLKSMREQRGGMNQEEMGGKFRERMREHMGQHEGQFGGGGRFGGPRGGAGK